MPYVWREWIRRKRASDPEFAECERARRRERYAEHVEREREVRRERQRARYWADPERERERVRQWRYQHGGLPRRCYRPTAKALALLGAATTPEILALVKEQLADDQRRIVWLDGLLSERPSWVSVVSLDAPLSNSEYDGDLYSVSQTLYDIIPDPNGVEP